MDIRVMHGPCQVFLDGRALRLSGFAPKRTGDSTIGACRCLLVCPTLTDDRATQAVQPGRTRWRPPLPASIHPWPDTTPASRSYAHQPNHATPPDARRCLVRSVRPERGSIAWMRVHPGRVRRQPTAVPWPHGPRCPDKPSAKPYRGDFVAWSGICGFIGAGGGSEISPHSHSSSSRKPPRARR